MSYETKQTFRPLLKRHNTGKKKGVANATKKAKRAKKIKRRIK